MSRRHKRSASRPAGAILLAFMVIAASAQQRGGSAGCNASPAGYGSTGAAGMDNSQPCPEQVAPPASNPAVKAKLDYEQNLKDAARLVQLASEVKLELQNGGQYIFSAATFKKSEEMEKLSKKLHDRMKADIPPVSNQPAIDATKRGK